jgi:hypothetical protein
LKKKKKLKYNEKRGSTCVSKGEVQVVDRVEEWEMNLERSCCCAIVGAGPPAGAWLRPGVGFWEEGQRFTNS